MTEFQKKYDALRAAFEQTLSDRLGALSFKPSVLDESFRYSLQLGGKRLRPVLMFAAAQMLGGRIADVAPLAVALEMIHTYSLIHDDLPAMDDDDFRRGQPSSHKKFGEGQAILAGDALLNYAYQICFEECKKGRTYLNAALLIAKNAGALGMVAGQAADLFWQGQEGAGEREYEFIAQNKTAKMFMSAAAAPAYVYGADENTAAILLEYGKNLGLLFQITDDLLDVGGDFAKLGKTVGKDEREKKVSAVRVYGIGYCETKADHYCELCCKLLSDLPYECGFLEELTRTVRSRER